jgi:mono/diheme cytochrome c family protein
VSHRTLLPVAGLCLAVAVAFGQESSGRRIFTSAQALAGQVVYEKSCGRCHTLTLMGRRGNPDERPTVRSLSEADQKFLADFNNRVPPLAGKAFLQRWGSKTAAQLVARFQDAKFSFKEAGLTDDEDIVRITAYVLQVNGGKPGNQALTRDTGGTINSVVE